MRESWSRRGLRSSMDTHHKRSGLVSCQEALLDMAIDSRKDGPLSLSAPALRQVAHMDFGLLVFSTAISSRTESQSTLARRGAYNDLWADDG